MKITTTLLIFVLFSINAFALTDSLGLTTHKGIKAIVYEVGAKESFYSIARKYKINPRLLYAFNSDSARALSIGERINIPKDSIGTYDFAVQQLLSPYHSFTHIVTQKETLFAISRKYQMTIQELKNMNNLRSDTLYIDQILTIRKPVKIEREAKNTPLDIYKTNVPLLEHYVKQGETLFSLAKFYNSTVDEIKSINRLPNNNLALFQRLVIKDGREKDISFEHKVEESETIYSIAYKYKVTTTDILSLNNLESTFIKVGQIIKIPYTENSAAIVDEQPKPASTEGAPIRHMITAGETLFSIANKYNTLVSEIVKLNQLKTNDIKVGDELFIPTVENNPPGNTVAKIPVVKNPDEEPPADRVRKEVTEVGIATWISEDQSLKSVALHKTAVAGTIMKITNPMNKKSIFVRVVGNFNETSETADVLVIITKNTADILDITNKRTRVEISYAD